MVKRELAGAGGPLFHRALRLHDPGRVRAVVEDEYERVFATGAAIDHRALLEGCAECRWAVQDELAVRREIAQCA